MKNRSLFLVGGLLSVLLASIVQAAKAPLSQAKLEKQASHIVTGEVISVTTKDRKSEIEKGIGFHRDRIFTIKLRVTSVAKGADIKAGDEIVVEAWKPIRRLPAEPGLQGHEDIPAKGDAVTVYATKDAKRNLFEPLLPNGIAAVESEKD